MDSFIKDCLCGDALITEINDYIDKWHESENLDMPLHIFLGMTKKEYELFVMDENYLGIIITAHKENTNVISLFQEQHQYRFAARSNNSQKTKAIEHWLKQEELW